LKGGDEPPFLFCYLLQGLNNLHSLSSLIKNNMKYITERITIDEGLMDGKPTIRETRITVQTILEFLSAGDTAEDILKQYPALEKEDVIECIRFAAKLMEHNYSIKDVAAAG